MSTINQTDLLFLKLLSNSLKNQIDIECILHSEDDQKNIFQLADKHLMLPFVFESIVDGIGTMDVSIQTIKKRSIQQVLSQYVRTVAFEKIYGEFVSGGIVPIVLKGIICRHTYPLPDHRQSWDEDIWIQKEEFEICDQILRSNGFERLSPCDEYEVVYKEEKSQLIIEVHTSLFPQESKTYGNLNRYFKDVEIKKIQIEDTEYYTLNDTDHLFYLICHMYKHFLHFGAGIRQLTDVLMYAKAYKVNWERIYRQCKEIHADIFVAALFSIGRKYLDMETSFPEEWMKQAREEETLLKDILEAGMQAQTSGARIHSATMTLNAVAKGRQGKKSSVWESLFPSAESLKTRYPYVRDHKYLLPVAWMQRIIKYRKNKNQINKTMKIGNQRINLLKKLNIIDE